VRERYLIVKTPSRRAAPAVAACTPVPAHPSRDSELAAAIKGLVVAGERDAARERFAELVLRLQRRAVRIAYNYLRDAHDAEEAVQDAFVKVFTHITTYREDLPFEVWFTRILVNGCLDLRKARARRLRWVLPMSTSVEAQPVDPVAPQAGPEDRLISSERVQQIALALEQLPERQQLVFRLCHIAELSTNEVSLALGVSEATVRVHLFRAIRKLRKLLGARNDVGSVPPTTAAGAQPRRPSRQPSTA
jgi:RNA polymerase sigma-70 factor (ECF subfamily)